MRVAFLLRAKGSDTGSGLRLSRRMIKNLLDENDDLFVHVIVGSRFDHAQEFWYDGTGHTRLAVHQVLMDTKPMLQTNIMTEGVYRLLAQDSKTGIVVDGVVNSAFGLGMHLELFTDYTKFQRQVAARPFHVTWDVFGGSLAMQRKKPAFWRTPGQAVLEAVSMLYADRIIHESRQQQQWVMETIREFVKPSVMGQILERSTVINNGIAIPAEVRRAPSSRKPVPFWGGGLSNGKGFLESMAAVEPTYQAGLVGAQVFTTYEKADHPKVEEVRAAVARLGGVMRVACREGAFHDAMQEGDFFVCASEVESYGLAWLEMLYAGLVGVFVRGSGVEKNLPPDYPFIVDSIAEAREAVARIAHNYAAAWQATVPPARRLIDQDHDSRQAARRFMAELRAVDARRKRVHGGKAAADAAGLSEGPLTIEQAYEKVSRMLTPTAVYELLQGCGWVDDCQGPTPVLHRGA
jgi:hypothetical protein